MEALAAVGLASNVLQFVELATKIVKTSSKLRQDGTSAENREHAAIAAYFRDLGQKMLHESRVANRPAVVSSPEDRVCSKTLLCVACHEKLSVSPTRQSWRGARIWQGNN